MALDPSVIGPSNAILQSIANPVSPLDIQAKQQALANARLQSQAYQQQIQTGALQQQQMQREIQGQTLMGQAYAKAMKVNADGTTSIDPQTMSDVFTQGNRPDLIPGMVSSIAQAEKTKADLQKVKADVAEKQNALAQAHADHAGAMGVAIQDSGYDSAAAKAHVQDALSNGFITPQQAQQWNARIDQDPSPAGIKALVDPIVAGNPAAQKFINERAQQKASTEALQATTAEKKAQQPGMAAESLLKDYSINALPGLKQAFAQGPQAYQDAYNAAPAKYQMLAPKPGTNITADALAKSGMTDKDQAEYDAKQQELKMTAQRNAIEATKARAEMAIAAINQDDRETKQLGAPFRTALTGAQQQLERIGEAQQMLTSGNAETQAAAIPKVLTAVVSGQGTGVRITQPELNAIANARGIGGDIQGTLQKWYDGKKLTPEQTRQLQGMLADVQGLVARKMDIATGTLRDIENAQDHNARVAASQRGTDQINANVRGTAPSATVPANVQAAMKSVGPGIHTLSDGSKWMKAADGTITKQ